MVIMPYMGFDFPNLNEEGPGYAEKEIVAAEVIDAHDHTEGNGVPITVQALNIDDDLDLGGFALVDVDRVQLNAQAFNPSGAAFAGSLVQTSTGGLGYINGAGSFVSIVVGAAVDTTASGSITGDYGTSNAELRYTDSSQTYSFFSNASTDEAGIIEAGPVKIRTTTAGATNFVTLASPVLAASYTLTFPTAAPASTSVVQMSSAGVLTATNTIANALTVQGDVTLSSNQSVTVQGTGSYKRGNKVRHIAATSGFGNGVFTETRVQADGTVGVLYIPVQVDEGERFTSVAILVDPAGAGVMTIILQRVTPPTTVTTVASSSTSGSAQQTITFSGLTETVTSSTNYYQIRVTFAASGDQVYNAMVTTDIP